MLVNRTSNNDGNTIYHCFALKSPPDGTKIGPVADSSNDVILSSVPTLASKGECIFANAEGTLGLMSTIEITAENVSTTVFDGLTKQNTIHSSTPPLIIIGAIAVVVILLIIIVTVLVCIPKFCRQKNNPNGQDDMMIIITR